MSGKIDTVHTYAAFLFQIVARADDVPLVCSRDAIFSTNLLVYLSFFFTDGNLRQITLLVMY